MKPKSEGIEKSIENQSDIVALPATVPLYPFADQKGIRGRAVPRPASKSLHSEMRAGDARQPPVVEGIETIDCSRIDLSFTRHSDYGSNTGILSDLFMLVKEDHPASKRPHLAKKKSATGPYWQFAPAILCTWHFDQ